MKSSVISTASCFQSLTRTLFSGLQWAALLAGAGSVHAASATWNGTMDALWTNNLNWSASPAPGAVDTATFSGSGNGFTTINLTGGVSVSNILFDTASAAAYTIGSGGAGSQTLTLAQTNGGIIVNSTVAANQTLNANLAYASTGTYYFLNNSANLLTLAGTNSASTTGIKVMMMDGTGNTTISGPIVSGSGSLNLDKTNSGTLTLSGGATWSGNGVNEYLPGSTLVSVDLRAGTTIITGGNYTNNGGEFTVGGVIANGGPGNDVNFTMNGGSLVLASGSWFSVGRGNGVGGVSSDVILNNNANITSPNVSLGYNAGSGLNFAKGSLTLNNNSWFAANGSFYIAESSGSDMTMTLNGAACFTNANSAGVSAGRSGKGTLFLNGTGTFYTEGDLVIGYSSFGPTNNALVVVNGGNLKVATTTKRWLQVGRSGSSSATLIVSNGTVQLDQNTDIRFSTQNTSTGTNTVSLEGGNITFYSDNATTVGGSGVVDLMQVGASSTYNTFNLDGGTLTVPQVVSATSAGTRVFNFNGGTLRAATDGVTLMNLGSGNAWANVRNGGAVIDSNGKNVTLAQPLLHSTIAGDNATDGGLTKNGSGTLTLAGGITYTYTGPTTVNAGTLVLGGTNLNSQAISVSDGATLGVPAATAVRWTPATLTVGNATGAALNFVVGSTSQAPLNPDTLTFNGANTINIVGGNFVAGNSYPLIAYTTLAGTGSYSLGALPSGVAGNLSAAGNTIYFNVTGVTNSLWTGAVNGTWDIATTANWTNVAGANTYSDGNPVQFDDTGLNTTTISNSVPTVLRPSGILVTNNTKNYAFVTTNLVIAGVGGLTKTGTANLTNATPNTYTGPTAINQGQLVVGVASVANVSGALGNNSAVTLGNDPTAVLNLNGFSTQIGSLTGGGPNAGNVVLGTGTLTVGGDNSSPAAYAGNISGSGGLTKIGAGTLTLSGTNTYAGATTVSGGTLTYASGVMQTNAATFTIGPAGGSGTMNVNSGSSVTFGQVVCRVGDQTGLGVLNLNGGTFSGGNDLRVGTSDVNGTAYNAYGIVNMTGGTVNIGSLTIARGNNNQNSCSGEVNISGGTLNSAGDVLIGFAGTGKGTLRISGAGTLNVGTTATKWLRFGQWDSTSGEIDITGGNLNLNWGTSIKFNQNNSSGPKTFNQEGGNVTFYSDFATTVGGGGNIDLMMSTGPATNTYNLDGGTLTVPQITSSQTTGGRIFNFNGGVLKAAAAGASFFNLGSGTAYANVRNGGAIIDSGGYNLTIAQPLQHSTIDGDNATDGGLTKIGNGTLTMAGQLSYTGPTRVLGGTLSLNSSVGLPSGGDLVVSNATLMLDATLGTMSVNNLAASSTLSLTMNPYINAISAAGNLSLGDNATLNLAYGTVTANPATAALYAAGSLANGTNIVINLSGTGFGPGLVPLIAVGSGTVGTNGFVLGALPSGIKGYLTNNAANTLDLYITSAGQLLTWHGADALNNPLPNWDINLSSNWYVLPTYTSGVYLEYLGNTIGDNVIFGDYGYNTDGTNHVNLSTNVVPATVAFSSSMPYTLTGTGGIGGDTSLVLTNNTGSIFLGTSNSYTGGTVIGGGTLIIINDSALGAAAGGVTLAGGTLQLNAAVADSRSIAVIADSSLGVATNVTAQLNGPISGTGGLTKTDDGTLILAGTNNITGTLSVNQGTLTTLGSNALAAVPLVGNGPALNGVLNVAGGVFNDLNNPANLYNSSLTIGNTAGAAGDMVVSGGVVNIPKQLTIGSASYGAYNQSGGIVTIGGFIACGGTANGGVFNMSGGTLNLTNCSATIGYAATTTYGVMNLSGSAVFNAFNNGGAFGGGVWPGEVGNGTLNLSGGAALTITGDGVTVGRGNAGGVGAVNLNGGLLTAGFISNGPGSGTFNFNGGTLKANASGVFTPGTASLRFYDYNGGAVIDDGGNNITFSQPIQAPSGYGIASIAVNAGTSSGYIDSPIVIISGGNGSNAMATATVANGAVTAITVTCPGSGYLNGDSVSVNFIGGGATPTPPTIGAITFVANGTGGLTKLGTGTLTLTGTNTYGGSTIVGQGTLNLTPAWQPTNSDVVVSNTATLAVTATGGGVTYVHNLTAGVAGTDVTAFSFALPAGNPANAVLECNNLTLNGTNTFKFSGLLTAGTFPVLKYHGTFTGAGALNPAASMPHGYSGVVSNDVATSTIYVTVSGSGGIVWQGYNPDPARTNLWDINSTTNWLSGLTPCTYFDGDKTIFDDTGSGTVLLSNNVSPTSVLITNNSVNYTIQGSGQINAIAGLTKQGAGTATLNVPGVYSSATVIANGVVSLGANQTFANLTGNGVVATASGAPTLTANNTTNTAFSGSIQGGLGLTKIGNGTLTLIGTNSFTGNLLAKGGALVIDNGAINNGTLWTSIGQDGSDNATLTLKGTASFTNNADFNIGDLGSATGVLNISNNATLTVGSMYVASANAAGSTASGTVNQIGGTVQNTFLVIGGRTSTNAVGVYNLTDGVLTDSGTARIGGVGTGTLNVSGTASVSVNGTGASYVGYRTGTGTLNLNGGVYTNVGELRVGGSDASGVGYNAYGMVVMTGGTVMLSTPGSGGSGGLTIARGNNYQNNCSGDVFINGGTFTCAGDVVVGYAGTGHGHLAINGGTFNAATTTLKWFMIPEYDTSTGELDITNGVLNLNAGTPIRMSSGNNTTGDNVINLEGGAINFYSDFATTLGGGGRLDMCAGSSGFTGNNIFNLDGGTLTVPQVMSSLANGTRIFNFNGGLLKPTGSSTTFFNLGSGNAFAYVKTGGARIDTTNYNITIDQPLLNDGVDEDGGLTKTGNGTLFLNGINTYTNVTTVNAGLLGGAGTIAGALVVNSGAGLAPGNGLGTLTVNGNITLNAGSTNVFEVNGSTPTNDLVVAGANVAYGGVLQIVPSGAFTAGQTFTLFSGPGAVNPGNFASIVGSPGPGLAFSFTNGVLSVVAGGVPPTPTITGVSLSGTTLTITGTNGAPGGQYVLLGSTNVALPLSQWTPLLTNSFDGAGNLNLQTNIVNLALPQEFYILSQ